jgi:hypothetical protein
MTATPALTTDLQKQVRALVDDLRTRVDENPELRGQWQEEHRRANEKERTAASWVEWRDDRLDQAGVAWVLTSVFIRFCEDNGLLKPVWITGPGRRRQEALDAQREFFQKHPESTDREWLMEAIDYLGSFPATRALVDTHSAFWWVSPSGDAVTELLKFWRDRSDDGALVHDLYDESLSTRFLGDLYQELSAHAKEAYALLQTPVFVEEHILDRTLEPALRERPLEGFRMIDPTCGSGHFLLGALDRLLDRWHKHAPNLEIQARVQSALDAIHGVDLNPFAVAIARFRLTVSALDASGLRSLEDAPAFKYHLAVGDSLIHGPDAEVLPGMEGRSSFMPFHYATENAPLLLEMLEEGRYDMVVGNPPYIQARDKALNKIYRSKFSDVCKGKYALTVPFMVEFFALAKRGEQSGWVGLITSNSFMKREFGASLIEKFLSNRDLRLVEDTSGAYLPGHGTPTVILIGRNQMPAETTVRAVLGVRGEPSRPDDPTKGIVWTSIIDHVDEPGWNDDWITVADIERTRISAHPWSLSGGGAMELMDSINRSSLKRLEDVASEVGIVAVIGEEDAFELRPNSQEPSRPVVAGESVRDYTLVGDLRFWPYDSHYQVSEAARTSAWIWPYRELVSGYIMFGKTREERGMEWLEYGMLAKSKLRTPMSIAFGEVATHNHFTLDRGGNICNRTAPVVKLHTGATEDTHLELLGVLNSSTVCFWLKQSSQSKSGSGIGRGIQPEKWMDRYQFNGANVQECPLPSAFPLERARQLDSLARELNTREPLAICKSGIPNREVLTMARNESEEIRAQMIAMQEELDWEVCRLYGIFDEDLTYGGDKPPRLMLGERAFEIALARSGEETAWFERHGSKLITEIPTHWPSEYQALVQRRLQVIAEHPFIRLLEKPEYKRRWLQEPWEKRQERALRRWLFDRIEDRQFWFDASGAAVSKSIGQLADEVSRDSDILSVLALWEGRPDVPVTNSLVRLLEEEALPFLAAYRYKDSGLRKREAWEETWAKQRREDAGEQVADMEIPPKYTSADFRRTSYWRARGALDVPKERFVLYPDASREGESTPLLGWAGWDHAQQALALAAIIQKREQEGWDDERLVPLVAGLAELQPWVEQWHTEVIPEYGASYAEICRQELDERAAQVGKTREELAGWRPAAAVRGRKKASHVGAGVLSR